MAGVSSMSSSSVQIDWPFRGQTVISKVPRRIIVDKGQSDPTLLSTLFLLPARLIAVRCKCAHREYAIKCTIAFKTVKIVINLVRSLLSCSLYDRSLYSGDIARKLPVAETALITQTGNALSSINDTKLSVRKLCRTIPAKRETYSRGTTLFQTIFEIHTSREPVEIFGRIRRARRWHAKRRFLSKGYFLKKICRRRISRQ